MKLSPRRQLSDGYTILHCGTYTQDYCASSVRAMFAGFKLTDFLEADIVVVVLNFAGLAFGSSGQNCALCSCYCGGLASTSCFVTADGTAIGPKPWRFISSSCSRWYSIRAFCCSAAFPVVR